MKRLPQGSWAASKKADKKWLTEMNSQSLLASLAHLDVAFSKGVMEMPQHGLQEALILVTSAV